MDTIHNAPEDTLGGRIGRARVAADMSLKKAARRLGVKPSTWQAWESDRIEPRSNRLAMLAGLLGVSPTWLLVGRGQGPDETMRAELDVLVNEISRINGTLQQSQSDLAMVMKRLGRFRDQEQEIAAEETGAEEAPVEDADVFENPAI